VGQRGPRTEDECGNFTEQAGSEPAESESERVPWTTADHPETTARAARGSCSSTPVRRRRTRSAACSASRLGADDYLTRAELDGDRLVSAVLLAIERGRRSALEPPIRDPLTGVANRLLFIDRVRLALARRRRTGLDVMVTLIDLDSFKDINDLLGHAAGDTVLVTVASRLRGSFRATDTIARLGGDEFGVLCEGTDLRGLEPQLMEKIDSVFKRPVAIEGEDLVVAASVGTVFAGDDERDAEALLGRADAAMHERGRGSTDARPPDGGHQSIDDLRV
jgi:diguanylate cyclase (GGDEF)-like protein